jgi:hypothetical protein
MVGLLALLVLCDLPSLEAQEGKLQKVRDEASSPSSSGSNDESRSSGGGGGCDSEDASDLFNLAAVCCVVVPYWVPAKLLGDDFGTHGYFLPYPYANSRPGSMQFHLSQGDKPLAHEDHVQWWLARVAVEESNDFHSLNRVTGHLLLDSWFRVGLQTSWSYLTENLKGNKHDNMGLGDVNLVFRFAQNEYVQMRSGLGVRLSTDSHETHAGFNFTYSADIYPIRPLVFSALIDAGTLGSAGLFHGRISAGVQWRKCELYAGYHYLLIGSVDLQGPVAGLRFWF